jgi:predicted nuclease of predicted toxin-antitoxin system
MQGFPPKVVWIRLGNCKTQPVEALLRRHHDKIKALEGDEIIGVLTLFCDSFVESEASTLI